MSGGSGPISTKTLGRRSISTLAGIVTIAFASAIARGDAIWTGPVTGAPLIRDVHITDISNGKLIFDVVGRSSSRDLAKVSRIAVDNEPAMTAGEDAFAVDKFDDAITNYTKVVRSAMAAGASKAWLADWASRRLQIAADKTSRFDAAVTAYVTRLQFDGPANVQRPALPETQSTYLDTAVADVNATLANPKLTDDQRIALLTFLIDLHRARHDAKSADATAEKMDEVLAKDPTNPSAFRAIGRRKLQAAQVDADRKDWRGAFAEIDANRAAFSDPAQQAEALYLLAECRYQIATAVTNDNSSATAVARTQAYKEASLAFMRLIANFKDAPEKPHVAQSLFRVAQLEELIGDARAAVSVYDQFIMQFPDNPAVGDARRSVDRLRASISAATTTPTSNGMPTTQPQ